VQTALDVYLKHICTLDTTVNLVISCVLLKLTRNEVVSFALYRRCNNARLNSADHEIY